MKKIDFNYKARLEKYIFENNWIEPPLFDNNKGKVLRFDLISKSETQSATLIKNVFDDLFFVNSQLFVIFYGSIDPINRGGNCNWKNGKKYFKKFGLKKVLYKNYKSKDEDNDEKNYLVVCVTTRNIFNLKKYLADYLEDKQVCQMAFLSLKKGATIQMYDSRGFDLLSIDQDFLQLLYKKYEKNVVEFNNEKILKIIE